MIASESGFRRRPAQLLCLGVRPPCLAQISWYRVSRHVYAEREHEQRDSWSRARLAVNARDVRDLVAPEVPALTEVRGRIVWATLRDGLALLLDDEALRQRAGVKTARPSSRRSEPREEKRRDVEGEQPGDGLARGGGGRGGGRSS
jgi:hypothetical protein